MNPYDCRIELRSRSSLEVFDLTVRVFRAWFTPIAKLSAVWLLPWTTLFVVAAWWLETPMEVGVVIVLLARILQAPYTLLCSRMLFAEAPRTRDVLRSVLAKLPAILLAWVASLLQLLMSLCLAAIPWFFLYPWTLFLGEALLLEGVPLGRAVSRATSLSQEEPTKAIFGSTLIAAAAAWCVMASEGMAQALFGYVLQAGTPFGDATDGDVTPFLLVGLVLSQPVIALFRLMLYVDVRTTLEGWDLQVAMRAAAEEA